MLKNIADFLTELLKKEVEVIKQYEFIKHGPMIGDMYEGLTKNLLEKSLPRNSDIRIVSGMITNDQNELSNQVDCMIVDGEGTKLPYSDDYLYHYSQVIAIIEVKKTLYKAELIDSYQKMKRVFEISGPTDVRVSAIRDAYMQITQNEVPIGEELEQRSLLEQMVYHTIVVEECLPLRIVFGYEGYTSEFSLREAFCNYILENVSQDISAPIYGFGPHNFPNLIVAKNSSLVKMNAMPYVAGINNGMWDMYASSSVNPLLMLLEIFWTRLSYKYGVSDELFGEDLESEVMKRYISAKPSYKGSQIGWEYAYYNVSREELESVTDEFFEWEPAILDDQEALIINWICNEGELNLKEPGFMEWLKKEKRNLTDVIDSLREKRLIYVENDQFLKLTTKECAVVIFKENTYAAENNTGRLTRWINKQMNN